MALVTTRENTTAVQGEGSTNNVNSSGSQNQTTTQTPGIKTTTQEEQSFQETTLVSASTSTTTSREESPTRVTTTLNGPKSSRRVEAPFVVTQTKSPSETVQVVMEDAIIKLAFTLQVRNVRTHCP